MIERHTTILMQEFLAKFTTLAFPALLLFAFAACDEGSSELPDLSQQDGVEEPLQTLSDTTGQDLSEDSDSASSDTLVLESSSDDMDVDESLDELAALGDEELPEGFSLNSDKTSEQNRSESPSSGDLQYQPEAFGTLLRAHVSAGRVDYASFKRDPAFKDHIASLEGADPGSMGTNEALAFWVNAYNALVIHNVNSNPGMKRPTDVGGFFDRKRFKVAGRSLTLNEIENEVVRPTFREPLIHFGLVCAAKSCPPLVPTLYTAGNVRSLLRKNTVAYLGDRTQNRFVEESNTLELSKIFDWYREDFGGNDAGIIAFVKEHAPSSMKEQLEGAGSITLAFREYDWTLNGR